MLENLLVLFGSLVILVKGSDYFIESVARLAKKLGISEFIIGLTLTALGTSIPELASSVAAALEGHTELVIGNVIGSNIANIGLIVGIAAILHAIKTKRRMYERDGYMLISSVILFFVFSLDNVISKVESGILLGAYVFYMMFIVKSDSDKLNGYRFRDFMRYVFDFQYLTSIKSRFLRGALKKSPSKRTVTDKDIIQLFKEGIVKDIIVIILSCVGIIFGAKYLVIQATFFATEMAVPEALVGLSIIAIGTSLPELMVSLIASQKGHSNIIVGNVLGSNIANICLIVGISGLISPIAVPEVEVVFTIPIMLFFSLGFIYFIKSNKKIGRWQGAVSLVLYLIFMVFAFLNSF